MEWLETAVVVVHVLVSLGLIVLIMMQQGKGAEAGASFGGGASQTVFGSQGSGTFMTKTTKYLALIFFTTSLSLAVIAKHKAELATSEGMTLNPVKEAVTKKAADTGKEAATNKVIDKALSGDKKAIELKSTGGGEPAAPELE